MTTDAELLRRYAEEKSEAAFGELVRRQVNLVYAVALRQCGGDASLAQDVTQRVFTDLARKARQLSGRAMLGGWLYRSTWFAASDVVRTERRRRAREQEAQAMQDAAKPAATDADWENLAPLLDQCVGELSERDRDAVVARFFEGKTFSEIGAMLRLTEDAARMRVERALDKLRATLVRRGATSTSAALGLALANQAATAAPAGVAASIAGTALTAAAQAGSLGLWAGFFIMTKTQTVAAAILGAGLASLAVLYRSNTDKNQELENLRRENAGRAAAPAKPARQPAAPIVAPIPDARLAPATSPAAPSAAQVRRDEEGNVVPLTSMIEVEHLTNRGRATPADALQTLFWSMIKGDEDEMVASLIFGKGAQEKAEAWRASLPPESQARFSALEKLPGLLMTEEVLRKAVALQIVRVDDDGPGRAIVRARGLSTSGNANTEEFPMEQTPTGWRFIIPANMVEGMLKSRRGADPRTMERVGKE